MNYSEIRMAKVECRVAVLRRQHEKRMTALLTLLNLAIAIVLIGVSALATSGGFSIPR